MCLISSSRECPPRHRCVTGSGILSLDPRVQALDRCLLIFLAFRFWSETTCRFPPGTPWFLDFLTGLALWFPVDTGESAGPYWHWVRTSLDHVGRSSVELLAIEIHFRGCPLGAAPPLLPCCPPVYLIHCELSHPEPQAPCSSWGVDRGCCGSFLGKQLRCGGLSSHLAVGTRSPSAGVAAVTITMQMWEEVGPRKDRK